MLDVVSLQLSASRGVTVVIARVDTHTTRGEQCESKLGLFQRQTQRMHTLVPKQTSRNDSSDDTLSRT
jgi:hypothetical protein